MNKGSTCILAGQIRTEFARKNKGQAYRPDLQGNNRLEVIPKAVVHQGKGASGDKMSSHQISSHPSIKASSITTQ